MPADAASSNVDTTVDPRGATRHVRRIDDASVADVISVRHFAGSCHCGAIRFTFSSRLGPESWRIRACQCRFCRPHHARTTSDPEGQVSFQIDDDAKLQRYRFALQTADFLVCRVCGVYVAAVVASPLGRFATLNVNTIDGVSTADAAPTSYDGETPDQRQERRMRQWTPVIAGT